MAACGSRYQPNLGTAKRRSLHGSATLQPPPPPTSLDPEGATSGAGPRSLAPLTKFPISRWASCIPRKVFRCLPVPSPSITVVVTVLHPSARAEAGAGIDPFQPRSPITVQHGMIATGGTCLSSPESNLSAGISHPNCRCHNPMPSLCEFVDEEEGSSASRFS